MLASFGCSFIQSHTGSLQENAHVERSDRTDDEQFYIPRLLSIRSPKAFFFEAMNYLYYYNVVRKHSALVRASPWQFLAGNNPHLHTKIKFAPPVFPDSISVQLGDWSGYHVLAHPQNHGFGIQTRHNQTNFRKTIDKLTLNIL